MSEKRSARPRSVVSLVLGVLALAAGVAAFAIPLHHAGPYGIPGRGLAGGLACLAVAGVLLSGAGPRGLRILALVSAPFVLFLALYGALAELEEVVVLHAKDAELRLWVVDYDGVPWVSMPRSKAERHRLDGGRLELLRGGELRCVIPHIVDDPVANRRTFDLRQTKYAIQRLGGLIGMFGDGPGPETITLRLDPC